MKAIHLLPVVLLAGCASTVPVPDSLKPTGRESLARIVAAKGVQIYECRDSKWVFVAPEADLFDSRGKHIGWHYAGPHWELADGSKVVGSVRSRADAPVAGAIPWLLLNAKSVSGRGSLSEVTSIQRVATAGGLAPAGGCETAGRRARVEYSADYYFFTGR